MKRKIFRAPFELKEMGEGEAETGAFSAVFATLNVKDHDGDVTPPGAFEEGQVTIVEPWNHGWTLPVGKGMIHADNEKAWVEGQFFLDTQAGLDHYKTVKAMGNIQEWSYTFDILESGEGMFKGDRVRFLQKMDVVGVSPVTRGAGIETRTVMIKGEKGDDDVREDGGDGRDDPATPVKRRIEALLIEADAIQVEAEMPIILFTVQEA